jgi:hypothetical protein
MIEFLDSNGDGQVDMLAADTDLDGMIDAVGLDQDGNGILDVILTDRDADSVFETAGVDTDQNGLIDGVTIDDTGDGVFDRVVIDADENGVDDAAQAPVTVVGGAPAFDGPAGLIIEIAEQTGQVTGGTPDSDGDTVTDDRDAAPTDPRRA